MPLVGSEVSEGLEAAAAPQARRTFRRAGLDGARPGNLSGWRLTRRASDFEPGSSLEKLIPRFRGSRAGGCGYRPFPFRVSSPQKEVSWRGHHAVGGDGFRRRSGSVSRICGRLLTTEMAGGRQQS